MLRRDVVTCGVLVLGLLGGACTSEGADDEPSPAPPAATFLTRGGDAFSGHKLVSGRTECDDVVVEANGERVRTVDISGTSFEAEVPLAPGKNDVSARCGDEREAARIVFHRRTQPHPTARIDVRISGRTVTFDGGESAPVRGSDGALTYAWTPDEEHPASLRLASGKPLAKVSGERLRLRAPAGDGEYHVALQVADELGRTDEAKTYFEVEGGVARAVDMEHEHPAWIDRAVVYAPIPALWGNGGPRSVHRRLEYLDELGVDALWLWPPVTQRAPGEEYAITDYFELDPSWGPEAAFVDMVRAAHRLGLKVLVDFVPNHLSVKSPYFADAKEYGEASPYWDFFDRRANGEPTHYFDWTHLPNLNFDNPEVRAMVSEAFEHWVADMGIDGFRVDVAWGVKRRRPGFWSRWRSDLKSVEPDVMLIAEAPAVDPYYFSNGFDVAYDWSHDVGQWAWTSIFDFPEEAGALLQGALTDGGRGYSPDAAVMRFLNNNDTGIRFVDQYGPEMTRVAATLQFTVPGVPAMFAGDEIGASYEPYSNLTPIPWRDRFNLRDFYERLIELKDERRALWTNEMEILETDSTSTFAYLRPADDAADYVLVVLNFGGTERVSLDLDPAQGALLEAHPPAFDLLSGRRASLDLRGDKASVGMDAVSSLVAGARP